MSSQDLQEYQHEIERRDASYAAGFASGAAAQRAADAELCAERSKIADARRYSYDQKDPETIWHRIDLAARYSEADLCAGDILRTPLVLPAAILAAPPLRALELGQPEQTTPGAVAGETAGASLDNTGDDHVTH